MLKTAPHRSGFVLALFGPRKIDPSEVEGSISTTLECSVLRYVFALFRLLLLFRFPRLLPRFLAGLTLCLLAALARLTLLFLLLALLTLVAFALYALRLIGFLFLIHKSLSNPGDQVLRCLGISAGMRTLPAAALVLETIGQGKNP